MSDEDVILRIHDKGSQDEKRGLQYWSSIMSTADVGLAYLSIMMAYEGKADFAGYDPDDRNIRKAYKWLEKRKHVRKNLSGVYEVTSKGKKYYKRKLKQKPQFKEIVESILQEDREKQNKE